MLNFLAKIAPCMFINVMLMKNMQGISSVFDLNALFTQDSGIPWRQVLSSLAVWAAVVIMFCYDWTLTVLMITLPLYFDKVLHLDVMKVRAHVQNSLGLTLRVK